MAVIGEVEQDAAVLPNAVFLRETPFIALIHVHVVDTTGELLPEEVDCSFAADGFGEDGRDEVDDVVIRAREVVTEDGPVLETDQVAANIVQRGEAISAEFVPAGLEWSKVFRDRVVLEIPYEPVHQTGFMGRRLDVNSGAEFSIFAILVVIEAKLEVRCMLGLFCFVTPWVAYPDTVVVERHRVSVAAF